MDLNKAVDNVYKGRERLIILGLTGRTGAGCTTVAKILEKEDITELDIQQCKDYDYKNVEERKNKVIYEYMKEKDRWQCFSTIEVSSLILSSALEQGKTEFEKYIDKVTSENKGTILSIGDKIKFKELLSQIQYMFDECKKYSLLEADTKKMESERINEYCEFYLSTIKEYKKSISNLMSGFSCYEIQSDKLKGKQQKQYHLYTFMMQQMGNNIRCSGNPFNDNFTDDNYRMFVTKIDKLIKLIIRRDENKKNENTRICIDAIRNPYEAMYFKDKYKAFRLVAINTDDRDRKGRLVNLNTEELENLDEIEYAQKMKEPQEVFYHQNIQGCLEIADIHIYNPDIYNGKYYELTTQILKYVSLMLHPGLVTPTHIERCMQLAYNAKFNSGCLSRQVGAVVTRADYSIQSVGWNDVPKGQISCNLRDANGYCKNKDKESFSEYEIENKEFSNSMLKISNASKNKTSGRCMSYCFKDVYNGLKGEKNQVYTRALHAEENAFLQISKYGGTEVKGGCLFTTASPCELCAKKAYQLGIEKIYYIDPYPGISQSHILTFGSTGNPEMKLFYGAIGQSYLDFYQPRISIKDELEMVTGVNVKSVVKSMENKSDVEFQDIEYENIEIKLEFKGSRNIVESTRKISATIQKNSMEKITKRIIWTGSSYEKTQLIAGESDEDLQLLETSKKSPFTYDICMGNKRNKGDSINYQVITRVKDEKQVMEPYFAHMVKNLTKKLKIIVKAPENLLRDVKTTMYADLEMKTKIKESNIQGNLMDNYVEFVYEISDANVNYTYAIEWNFE